MKLIHIIPKLYILMKDYNYGQDKRKFKKKSKQNELF